MTDIRQYLDSTYLKTAEQAGLDNARNREVVKDFVNEAIAENFKLVMIRPQHVRMARKLISEAGSTVAVGTVIDFPEGKVGLAKKLEEAEKAIADGADELDFVCNYEAFKNGETESVKQEIIQCTHLCLSHMKIAKWIIETAALDLQQVAQLSAFIKQIILSNFTEANYASVFVKSSTGFYNTNNNQPNGATLDAVITMLENAAPLPVKAAGGVRTYQEAVEMINLGVKRIGTSAAKAIAAGESTNNDY